ncbi:MAG TPA: STM3941 family protein [Pyrinomonadaceae bacterium]|jgi:hypothetical protein|nr:STM3941 family protein [Pyrinomonadaceae bacterium]
MSHTEIHLRQPSQWKLALITLGVLIAAYLFFGYIPLIFLLAGAVIVIRLFTIAIRGEDKVGPVIILNDEGVFDERLKVGVIRWEDIRRIKSHSLSGGDFISLELHDMKTYEARRPVWFRLFSKIWLVNRISPINIGTRHLDMDHKTLLKRLHEGCERATTPTRIVNIG